MNHTAKDSRVDGSRDEDDRQSDSKCDARNGVAGGQQGRSLNISSNESEDQSTGDGVDEDLDEAQEIDTLGEVLWSVHLIHESELAHGERISEENIGDAVESLRELEIILWPSAPVNCVETSGSLVRSDASGDDGDADSSENGGEINISKNGDLGERGRNGENEKNDSRHDVPHDSAEARFCDGRESDGTGQAVRTKKECQLKTQHDIHEIESELPPHLPTSIGISCDMRELQLDKTDNPTGIYGNTTNTNRADYTCYHSQSRERGRNR